MITVISNTIRLARTPQSLSDVLDDRHSHFAILEKELDPRRPQPSPYDSPKSIHEPAAANVGRAFSVVALARKTRRLSSAEKALSSSKAYSASISVPSQHAMARNPGVDSFTCRWLTLSNDNSVRQSHSRVNLLQHGLESDHTNEAFAHRTQTYPCQISSTQCSSVCNGSRALVMRATP